MSSGLRVAALCLAVGLSAGSCGSDEPLATPPTASDSASPSASPSQSPSPSPSPLSAFEADPAVQGMRACIAAVAEAVNTKNLQLPTLLATSTARRSSKHQELFGEQFGLFVPGPNPVAVLGVRAVSDSGRNVLVCGVTGGFILDRPGGTPVGPAKITPGQYELLLEGGVWKPVPSLAAPDDDQLGFQGPAR